MRRTEAIDEAVQATDLALTGGDPASADEGSTLDQRRRRLVRGAAAFAPLVLTLRSGALAAASCTGTKIRTATTNARGQVEVGGSPLTSGLLGSNDNPNPDYCFKNVDSCPDTSLVDKISTQDMNDQSIQVFRSGTGGGTRYYCGTPSGSPLTGPADFRSQNIAILSSASATSLINAG